MRRTWVRLGLLAAVIVAVVLIAVGRGDVVAALVLPDPDEPYEAAEDEPEYGADPFSS